MARYRKLSECGSIGDWIVLNIFGDFDGWVRFLDRAGMFGFGVLVGYLMNVK